MGGKIGVGAYPGHPTTICMHQAGLHTKHFASGLSVELWCWCVFYVHARGPPEAPEGRQPIENPGADFISLGLPHYALCYAIVPPGRKAGFRAGFLPDSSRESLKIGFPAADFDAFPD